MSELYTLIFNTPDGASTTATTSFSLQLLAASDLELSSITIYGVKRNSSGNPVDLVCTINGVTYTGDEQINYDEYKNITFDLDNIPLTLTNNLTLTFRSGGGYIKLEKGRGTAPDVFLGTGVLLNSKNSVPTFSMNYYITSNPIFQSIDVNEGYPYFRELENNFPNYQGEDYFLRDKNGLANEGYPYFSGLTTAYSSYEGADAYRIDPTIDINEGYPFLMGLYTTWGKYVEPVIPIAKAVINKNEDGSGIIITRSRKAKITFYANA